MSEPETNGDATPEPATADAPQDHNLGTAADLDVDVNEGGDPGIRETLKDIGSRLPAYARLSQRLVAAGLMTTGQQGQLLGPLGLSPLSRVTRFVPLLGQVTRIVSMIGALRVVLTQLSPEAADQHLAEVGLTRAQVEADFQVTKDLSKRAGEIGAQQATRVLTDGARVAGRLTGKGLRAFKSWQANTRPPSPRDGDRTDRP